MPQIINTNLSSLNAQRNLNASQSSLATSLQRLSSGLRINSAKDDAAGLAITNRFTSQINGLNQAARNASDAISLSQTAEGGLTTVGDALQRIRELAVQSANATNSASDRAALQAEVSQLSQEITRIATTTQFNGLNLLDGTLNNVQFQVGANAGQTISFGVASALGSAIGNNVITTGNNIIAATSVPNAAAAAGGSAGVAVRTTAQNITVAGNGTIGTFAVLAGAAGSSTQGSARGVAASVNALTSLTGVSATATSQARLSGFTASGNVTFTLAGANNTTVGIAATLSGGSDLSALATAINAQSATTGITASATVGSGELILTSAAGDNIDIRNFQVNGAYAATNTIAVQGVNQNTGKSPAASTLGSAAVIGSVVGSSSTTVGGQVFYGSSSGFSVTSSATLQLGTFGLDSAVAANPAGSTLNTVSAMTVATVFGSNSAIATVDAALQTVNNIRAALGALQNRFSQTITNLQTSSENGSASRSRILDADFSAETANLSRSQVLQQAGVAMLAQANALPNQVLALLR